MAVRRDRDPAIFASMGERATSEGLDLDRLARLLHETAGGLGLTAAGFRLLRLGTQIVWGSIDNQVVARVSYMIDRPLQRWSAELRIVESLAQRGAPLLTPLCDAQPLADGRVATFWPMSDPVPGVGLEDVVGLVSQCHAVELLAGLEPWDATVSYLTRWRDRVPHLAARGVPTGVRDLVSERLHERVSALAAYCAPRQRAFRRVVLHGDPYASNVVRRGDGRLVLIDFDLLATGPPEVDLSAVLMQYKRYDGLPRVLARITDAYGVAVDEQLLGHIAAADEAISNAWLACLWGVNPAAEAELMHRIRTSDDPDSVWRWL